MSEKLDALRDLLAKVEGAEITSIADYEDAGLGWQLAHNANHGFLDSAKKLHEAKLPGFAYEVTSYGTAAVDGMGRYSGLAENNPARAWLIAILKALISEATE